MTGGGIVKILLHVQHLDAQLGQPGLVEHSLHHVTPDPVAFPGNDIGKRALFRIRHHPAEGRTFVAPAGHGSILVGVNQRDPAFGRVCLAGCHLLLNGYILLPVAAVSGIAYAN